MYYIIIFMILFILIYDTICDYYFLFLFIFGNQLFRMYVEHPKRNFNAQALKQVLLTEKGYYIVNMF